jgi:dienelactone hydrolase
MPSTVRSTKLEALFAPILTCLMLACPDAGSNPTASLAPPVRRARPDVIALDDLQEEVVRVPLGEHPGMTLETTIFRPLGPGPFPLVVMNHGAIGRRDPAPRWRPVDHARWFVSRGFVVAVPMRRGNAGSDGNWAEGYGPCETADFTNANLESASDIRAAVKFMARRPYVDAHRVVLHGMSAGGLAVLALASTTPEWDGVSIVGVLNFAGGRGSLSSDGGETRHNCAPETLVATVGRFGETISIPTLWLYAENDKFFPPSLAHRMFDAFSAHGARGAFVELPAFAREGHSIAWESAAIPLWQGQVARFLETIVSWPASRKSEPTIGPPP